MEAIDNYIAVTKSFKTLIQALGPYIARELKVEYGDNWWNEGVLEQLYDDQRRDLPQSGDYATLVDSLDEQRCLLLMDVNWRAVFGKKLPRDCKNWVMELKGSRNEWAHAGASGLSSDKASRALDTMQLLCEQIDPEGAEEIRDLLREVRYGSAQGSMASNTQQVNTQEAKPRKKLSPTVGAVGLPSWRNVMEPHPDVAEGRYRNAEFAANLGTVLSGKASIEYRDPVEFFSRTYITQGMEDLLVQAIQRIAGTGGEPVVQLKTAFGGGKTHSMLALYHLLRGKASLKKLPGIEGVIQKAGVDTQILENGANVAVIVGTYIDPSKPKRPANLPGAIVNTLWGEIAYQLAVSSGKPEIYDFVKEADKKHVSPGAEALANMFDACGPCLILVDELVAYAKKLYGVEGLPAGSFDNLITFIQEITEAASASKNSMVVASIPESDREIGGDSGQIALEAIEHTFGRMEAIWKPVAANEGFEVVRRRLFLPCKDASARDEVCEAFSRMYNENASEFPVDAKSLDYRTSMASCYPIHPEIFDRLYEDWATLQTFQRTRGVLRLMAAVIHYLWMNHDESPMIMPGSVPLGDSSVRDELTRYLDEAWNGIVDSEIDGKGSVPYKTDEGTQRYGKILACRRIARTIMLGSAPDVSGQTARGLETSRVRLGTIQPGENISIFNDALGTLKIKSSYLYSDANDTRYWYDTRPTLLKTVEDRVQLISDADAFYEIERRVRAIRRVEPFQGVHFCPSTTLDIPDEQSLRLVLLSPQMAHKASSSDSDAMTFAKEALAQRGTAPRLYKNMVVFAAVDATAVKPLKDEAKYYLAWKSIQDDRVDLNLGAAQDRETAGNISRRDHGVDLKLQEAYSWVLSPRIDLEVSNSDFVWDEDRVTGGAQEITAKAAQRLLTNEAVIKQWAPALLKMTLDNLLWKESDDIQIKKLWEYLCDYCYLPRLASYNVLEQAITNGLGCEDYFALAGGIDNSRYLDLKLAQSSAFVGPNDYLVKVDVAKRQLEVDAANKAEGGKGGEQKSGGGQDGPTDWTDVPSTPEDEKANPVTFRLSSVLDNVRVNNDVGKIVNEVVSQLESVSGCDIKITLEVSAHAEDGFDVPIQRIVSENCNTLHIDDFGFTR